MRCSKGKGVITKEIANRGLIAGARAFNHVNYEDPDINVAIPVFSIHGNHDDPSGVRISRNPKGVYHSSPSLGRPPSCSRLTTDIWAC